jgi:hypothetical protein
MTKIQMIDLAKKFLGGGGNIPPEIMITVSLKNTYQWLSILISMQVLLLKMN